MGGLAMEWTTSDDQSGQAVVRGGGIFSTGAWCRAAAKWLGPSTSGVQFGFESLEISAGTHDVQSRSHPCRSRHVRRAATMRIK